MKTCCALKCSVAPHSSLNTSKGFVCYPTLSKVTNDDIKAGLAEQGVMDVRRITVRRDGIIKLSNTFVFTFDSPNLPIVVKIGFIHVNVDHTGQCKRTGGCYNELVVAFFSTGGGVKGKNIYTC